MAGKRMMRQSTGGRASHPHRMGKGLYRALVMISGVIVVLFGAFKFMTKPPEQVPPPISTPHAPTDNPNTPDTDESQSSHTGLERKPNTWTFLLAASDQVSGNADTIMVVMYDTENQQVGMISIPRDTLVKRKSPKINSAYQGKEGMETLRGVVSDLLGIPIDHTISMDLNGFIKLVDAVGGVDFDVPVRMAYDDPTQDLHIHFEPGMQHLDGQAAMEVVRCRKNNDNGPIPYDAYRDADIGRTRTQQALLKTVAQKVLSNPQKIGKYLDIFAQYVKTDLEASEIAWFAQPALGFDMSTGFSSATLPGDGTVSYRGTDWCYQLYRDESLALINEMINPYSTEVTMDMINIFHAR